MMLRVATLGLVTHSAVLYAATQATPVVGGESDGGGWGDDVWTALAVALAAALVGVVGGVIGTLLGVNRGHNLSEQATARRDAAAEARQRTAVRKLLRVELDSNLGAVRVWLGAVAGDASLPARDLGRRAVDHPLPPLSRHMWETQANLLTVALTDEEIEACHRFYTDVDALQRYRQRLVDVANTDEARENSAPPIRAPIGGGHTGMRAFVPLNFVEEAIQWWPRILACADGLLTRGNPLTAED